MSDQADPGKDLRLARADFTTFEHYYLLQYIYFRDLRGIAIITGLIPALIHFVDTGFSTVRSAIGLSSGLLSLLCVGVSLGPVPKFHRAGFGHSLIHYLDIKHQFGGKNILGEAVHGIYLSLDPYMRGRISGVRSYARPTELGDVIEGRVVGEVVRSRHPDIYDRDYVAGGHGWQLYSAVDGEALQKLDPAQAPISTALGVLGLTAYVGLHDIGQPNRAKPSSYPPRRGRSARSPGRWPNTRAPASSASPAAPISAATSNRSSASTPRSTTPDLGAALDRVCPIGIDVYFENVGGAVQQAVFPRLNDFGRMVMCGMISEYNDVLPRPGPNLGAVVRKRLKIQGFIISDRRELAAEYRGLAAPLVRAGQLKFREDIVEGLNNAPMPLSACCRAGISANC